MRKKIILSGFIAIMVSLYLWSFVQSFGLDTYSSTLLAFSYQDAGFGSRILMGSIFKLFCSLYKPIDSAIGASLFSFGCSLIFDVSAILFSLYIFDKLKSDKAKNGWATLSSILLIILIPSFSTGNNLGKPDALILALTIYQAYLLLENKHEWLVPVLSIISILLHEGFFFMVACVPISITLYKAMKDDKYWKLFWINLIITVLGTGIMMMCKVPYSLALYDTMRDRAIALSFYQVPAENILNQRFGTQSLIENVVFSNTLKPLAQLPLFLLAFLPVEIEMFRLFKSYFKKDPVNIAGILIMLTLISVQYVMFCDYGRYIGWTLFSILMICAYLILNDEEPFELNFNKSYPVLLACAILATPLYSCNISLFTRLLVQ